MKKYDYIRKVGISVFGLVGIVAFSSTALAASHNYTCADFGAHSTPTCFNDTWTLTGSGYAVDTVPNFNLTVGTWYITTASDSVYTSGVGYVISQNNNTAFDTYSSVPLTEFPFTVDSVGGLQIGSASSFNGSLSHICVDNDGTSCTAGGGGGGGGGTPTATTTASSTGGIEFGMAIIIFFLALGFFGLIFGAFRRK